MAIDLGVERGEYRGHEYAVDFVRHESGIVVRMKIDDQPWMEDHDSLWNLLSEAKDHATSQAMAAIDRMEGR